MVVAKSLRQHYESNASHLRSEYEALLNVEHQLGRDLADSVPRALLLLEEDETLFTSLVEGVNFCKLLRRRANRLCGWVEFLIARHLQHCSCHIGEWLRTFHKRTVCAPSLHDHGEFIRQLDMQLNQCSAFGLSRELASTVKLGTDDLSRSLAQAPVDNAAVHGDFLPQNILVAGEDARILDFGSFRQKGPIYIDVSHFLAYLLILSRKPAYSRRAIEDVAGRFLSGYQAQLHPGLLQLYTTSAVLRILLDGDLTRNSISPTVLEDLLSDVVNNHYLARLGAN